MKHLSILLLLSIVGSASALETTSISSSSKPATSKVVKSGLPLYAQEWANLGNRFAAECNEAYKGKKDKSSFTALLNTIKEVEAYLGKTSDRLKQAAYDSVMPVLVGKTARYVELTAKDQEIAFTVLKGHLAELKAIVQYTKNEFSYSGQAINKANKAAANIASAATATGKALWNHKGKTVTGAAALTGMALVYKNPAKAKEIASAMATKLSEASSYAKAYVVANPAQVGFGATTAVGVTGLAYTNRESIQNGAVNCAVNVVNGAVAVKDGVLATPSAIVKGAKAVGNGIVATPSAIVSGAKATGNGVVNGAKAVGNGIVATPSAIVSGAKATPAAIVNGAKATGNGIVKGAKAVGNGIVATPSAIVSGVKATGNGVVNGVKAVGNGVVAAKDYTVKHPAQVAFGTATVVGTAGLAYTNKETLKNGALKAGSYIKEQAPVAGSYLANTKAGKFVSTNAVKAGSYLANTRAGQAISNGASSVYAKVSNLFKADELPGSEALYDAVTQASMINEAYPEIAEEVVEQAAEVLAPVVTQAVAPAVVEVLAPAVAEVVAPAVVEAVAPVIAEVPAFDPIKALMEGPDSSIIPGFPAQ